VAQLKQIARAFAATTVIATLLIAAGCSSKIQIYGSSPAGSQSSPTPTPTNIPKLKVAPYEPTI